MRLSIIMPVFNERATLEAIVDLVNSVDLTVNVQGANPSPERSGDAGA